MEGKNRPSGEAATPDGVQPRYEDHPGWCIEDVERYCAGGYHPVLLWDVLDERYRVTHKLGWGSTATVWLARDTFARSWVALRILDAEHSRSDCTKNSALAALESIDHGELAEAGIVTPTREFWIDGPNGRHCCHVLPFLGPKLTHLWEDLEITPAISQKLRSLCFDAARGMHFLHERGLCHGDFRPENIVLRLKNLDGYNELQLLEFLGQPQITYLKTRSGEELGPSAPEYVVTPAFDLENGRMFHEFLEEGIGIIDFGESFRTDQPPDETGIPETYAAPECLISPGGPPGKAGDIWSLMCTLYFIMTGELPFESSTPDPVASTKDQIERMIGPFPVQGSQPKQATLLSETRKSQQTLEEHKADSSMLEPENPHAREDGGTEAYSPDKDKGHSPEPGDEDPSAKKAKPARETNTDEAARESITKTFPGSFQAWMGRLLTKKSAEFYEPQEYRPTSPGKPMPRFLCKSFTWSLAENEAEVFARLIEGVFRFDPNQRLSSAAILSHEWFDGVRDVQRKRRADATAGDGEDASRRGDDRHPRKRARIWVPRRYPDPLENTDTLYYHMRYPTRSLE